MEPDEVQEPEGHPTEEVPEAVHPTEQLVRDAYAALKRGLDAFDRRGIGHAPNIDDVRLAFKALDAILEGVDRG
jgi:hypothetical protein